MDPWFLPDQLRRLIAGETELEEVFAAFEDEIAGEGQAFAGAVDRCYFAAWLYGLSERGLALQQLARSESFFSGHPDRPSSLAALALVLVLKSKYHDIVDMDEALSAARGAVESLCEARLATAAPASIERARSIRGTLGDDEPLLSAVCARHAMALMYPSPTDQATLREAQGWIELALACLPDASESSELLALAVGECNDAAVCCMAMQDEVDDEEPPSLVEVLDDSELVERLNRNIQLVVEQTDPLALLYNALTHWHRKLPEASLQALNALLERLDPNENKLEVGGCFLLLGEAVMKRGDLANAEKLLQVAWGFLEAALQPGHLFRCESRLQLARLFESTGDVEQAVKWSIWAFAEGTFSPTQSMEGTVAVLLGDLKDVWESSNLSASVFIRKLTLTGYSDFLRPDIQWWVLDEASGSLDWDLARLLIRAGRLGEALEILAGGDTRLAARLMLRHDEVRSLAGGFPLTPLESSQAARLWGLMDGSELEFDAHLKRTETTVLQIAEAFARADGRSDADTIAFGESLGERHLAMLPESGGATAVLRYLVLADHLDVLLLTPSGNLHVEVPTSEAEINDRAFTFLKAARDPSWDPTGLPLHDDLLPRALLERLDGEGISRLVIGAMGTLRFIPFAALHDGTRYLAERFPIVHLPESLVDLKARPAWPSRVALAGSTFPDNSQDPLPGVEAELDGIREMFEHAGAGTEFLDQRDEAFDRAAVQAALSGECSIVHVASHFRLVPSDASRSILSLGTGDEISLSDIDRAAGDLRGVDLVVLSACSTGVPAASLDAAGWSSPPSLLHARGVRSLVTTLWPVHDFSMSALIRRFYGSMFAPDPADKASALQQAQLQVMRQDFPTRTSHPFYWAGLKLSGNWMPFQAPSGRR